ncbi:hypothetical protein FRB94_000333 [Tulasnella sp. JGI-2019a]|nr:hypothetical protein FRB94_000333 [Tulasnella sp. JGI-2019a]
MIILLDVDRPTPSFPEPAPFTGGTLADCQKFILSIRKYARALRRLRDPAWIVDYVSCCLDGEAQLWHIRLSSEVTEGWVELQIALVEHYSHPDPHWNLEPNRTLEPIPQSHHEVDRTAMRPTIRDGSRLGIIEIHSDAVSGPRYIYVDFRFNGGNLADSHSNVKVRYLPSHGGPQNLQLATPSTDYSYLGITRRADDDSDEVWADECLISLLCTFRNSH